MFVVNQKRGNVFLLFLVQIRDSHRSKQAEINRCTERSINHIFYRSDFRLL